jgi:hypothetical protein
MDSTARIFVRERAGGRCEYCLIRQEHYESTLHVEHIVAKKHGGDDHPMNPALSCSHCNLHKGPNLAGLDPKSGQLVPLFNPRKDLWSEHFELNGPVIRGFTPTARATVHVLSVNASHLVDLRADLITLGEYP